MGCSKGGFASTSNVARKFRWKFLRLSPVVIVPFKVHRFASTENQLLQYQSLGGSLPLYVAISSSFRKYLLQKFDETLQLSLAVEWFRREVAIATPLSFQLPSKGNGSTFATLVVDRGSSSAL